jgi:ATP-dependent DNA helicase RecG
VEWKESAQRDDLLQTVCAMANDLRDCHQPGYVLLGVRRDGTPVGVGRTAELDPLQQKLSDWLRSTKIAPTPSFAMRVEQVRGQHVMVLVIQPYPVPPIVMVDGTAWVRVGTTTRRATEADLTRLRERRPEHLLPFDLRPCRGATLPDIDQRKLREIYEADRARRGEAETFPVFEAWLTQKQLGRPAGGGWAPNTACVLLFGLSPQSFLPGAKAEFVRYGGLDVEAPVTERKTIAGTLPDQLESLWAQLSAHLTLVPAGASGPTTPYVPLYPLDALRELARNMVQHRQYEGTHAPGRVEWYDDRIEFYNPGAPFGRASEGQFGDHADYRNPIITQHLVELGYVEQLGRGIRLVRLLLERNGNPQLEARTDGYTRVIVRARR